MKWTLKRIEMPVISAKCPMNKSARLELSSLTKLELDKPDPKIPLKW